MKWAMVLAVAIGGCCALPCAPDLSVASSDLVAATDAPVCVSCIPSERTACESRPSTCSCYPGPACCCKKAGV